MAGLFDDNSFKVAPMMGKRARGKLNKHGYYRMPPNLKGLPAAAKGGLGGAATTGKKMRGFAKGGLAEALIGEKAKQITGGLGSDVLSGTGADDWLTEPDQQDTTLAATPEDFTGGLAANTPISPKDLTPDETADILKSAREKIAAAQQAYMQNAQDTLAGMQAPKDTSALAFYANLGKPKPYGGGFAEDLRNAASGYQSAQNDYQKQLMAFNELRAKLGMETASVPLTGAYKDAEMAQKAYDQRENRANRLEIAGLRAEQAKANQDPYEKEYARQGIKTLKEDSDYLQKSVNLINAIGQPGSDKSIEKLIDYVQPGPIKEKIIPIASKLGDKDYSTAVTSLNNKIAALRLGAAEFMKGQGSITENERALLGQFAGGMELTPEAFKEVVQIFRENHDRLPRMLKDWDKARKNGEKDYLTFKNNWTLNDVMNKKLGGDSGEPPPTGEPNSTAAQSEKKILKYNPDTRKFE